MARRPVTHFMEVDRIRPILERERQGGRDMYARLSGARIEVRDPLGPVEERYGISVPMETGTAAFTLTPTSVRQLAGIAGMPLAFLDGLPPAIGVATLRSCLAVALETRDDPPFLLRVRPGRGPRSVLRAILPASFLRFDDREVLEQVAGLAGRHGLRAQEVEITDASFLMRLVLPGRLSLGAARAGDEAVVGLDVRNSEVGRHALEVRRCVLRLICTNGVTSVAPSCVQFRRRKVAMDRDRFREVFTASLDEAMALGMESRERLGRSQSDFVLDPVAEVKRVFRRYRLGNPLSEAARMVAVDAMRNAGLLGVTRFELVQSFTKVAQTLEREQRVRLEDAMGEYLFQVGEEDKN